MNARNRPILTVALAASLLASLGGFADPTAAQADTSPFTDIAGTTFEADIVWLYNEGITVGCSPTTYCPDAEVTRGQMASFLVRMFELTEGAGIDAFSDDDGTTHEQDINRLAHAGITKGCTPTTFCPTNPIRRDEMASFLVRAIPLTEGAGRNYFRDDDGTTHEANIDRAAAAGITSGCYPYYYCPAQSVTRGQMAGFLHRVVKPVTPPPYPAPSGSQTLNVEIDGVDKSNSCLDEDDPCRTIRHALELALDGDTIEIGVGTFREESLWVRHRDDLTIVGDPGGGTIIDASGGEPDSVLGIRWSTVTVSRLTLTGGAVPNASYSEYGAGIICDHSTVVVSDSTITGNDGTGILASPYNETGETPGPCDVTVVGSTLSENTGTPVFNDEGSLTITDSTISGNSEGAIGKYGGSLTITGSTISDNAGEYGAIVATDLYGLVIANSTVSGNASTNGYAGAILIHASLVDTHVTVVNSTISGNVGQARGAGIFVEPGVTLDVVNSIIAGNTAPTDPDVFGSVALKVASIVGVPAGLTLADILDPAGLADNGGPTQTIALTDSPQNPAIGKGDAAICASAPVNGMDQRGEPRTPLCDIGAYEVQP